jgi:hypothetical protein
MRQHVLSWLVLCAASFSPGVRSVLSNDAFPSKKMVDEFVSTHCLECHRGELAESGLDLSRVPFDLQAGQGRLLWVKIYDRIDSGEMPPDKGAIEAEVRQQFLARLQEALHVADYAEVQLAGRGSMRRLNRREFELNLRELLHLPDLDVKDMLPEDREGERFNKTAETLDVTRVQLAAYLDATGVAVRQAVASGTKPVQAKRYHALATNMFPKAIDHAGRESTFYAKDSRMVPLTAGDLAKLRKEDRHDPEMEVAIFRSASWPYYGYPEGFLAEHEGRYRVRFFARAVRQVRDFRLLPAFEPVPMTFRARQPSKADVSGDVRAVGGLLDIQPEGQVYETSVLLSQGETFEYSLLGLPVPFPITSHGGPLYYDFPPMPEAGHPGVAFSWLEITGPVPPSTWPPESHRALFGDLRLEDCTDGNSDLPVEVLSTNPASDARRLLRDFAQRAARRPVSETALKPYERLIDSELEGGASFTEAMLAGYQAFLCSSHFLFLHEPGGAADQYDIAARLSHFLWNSRPDATLLELAEHGELRNQEVLRAQIDRMIADERIDNCVDNFTDYWLDLKNIQRDLPDLRLYPEYRSDDYLIQSMERETQAFFRALLRENLPVTTLVDADFVWINDRLAKHYELPPVIGSAIRKVSIPSDNPRGGLLTQAAILKVTANGTTTSPITRGAWIVDRILGDPPPPPPDKVPAIEPDLRGATTIREQLAQHARAAECAGCHARFDPVGFALENFDVLGGWRDRYRSLEKGDEITGIDRAGHRYSYRVANSIDAAGQLRSGESFQDIVELKRLLRTQARQLARNLLQRFTIYATGTPVRFSDRREIEAILNRRAADDYCVGDLLKDFVASPIFLNEPNPD